MQRLALKRRAGLSSSDDMDQACDGVLDRSMLIWQGTLREARGIGS